MSAWDDGIHWLTNPSEEFSDLPLALDYVRDQVIRAANGQIDDQHITELIYTALEAAEEMTDRAVMPRTWTQILNKWPPDFVVLQRPPLIDVTAIQYYDEDDVLQTWTGSPLPYLVIPSGRNTKARIVLADGESWPTVSDRPDAITITFRAGYIDETVSPPAYPIPYLIKQGMCVHMAEQYKQRGLGVQNVQLNPAPLQLAHFWKKVY